MGTTFRDPSGQPVGWPVDFAERYARLRGAAAEHGEHTIAGEMVAMVEAVLSHLGRLWVAEYLHAGAPDPRLNRDLFDRLGRPMPLGHWVSIARRIRQVFADRSLPTVVHGLGVQDFGAPGDSSHPIARLVHYRNSFSHGSMTAVVEDIRAHRALVDEVLARLPALSDQPIRFRAGDDGPLYSATLDWTPAPDGAGRDEPPLQPFVVGMDRTTILRLYPLLYVVHDGPGYALRHGRAGDLAHPLSALFERGMLQLWYERYLREQQGHLTFDDVVATRDVAAGPDGVLAEVGAALADDAVSLVLVEAHPGCGATGVLTRLRTVAPVDRYRDVSVFVVTPGDLGQSGVTFARYLLRRVERALDLPAGSLPGEPATLLATLRDASAALRARHARVLVGVDDLHFGVEPYRGEPITVAEVYRSLAGSALAVVATTQPGRIAERLAFDRKVSIPVPGADGVDRRAVAAALHELCAPEGSLPWRVLQQLLHHEAPRSLFAVCDALEAESGPVFEPAVERALRDLRPLLLVHGAGAEKRWMPFSPVLEQVADAG